MSVLVLSWDRVGTRMAGSAIRALEMAKALARGGVDVILAAPDGSELAEESGVGLACFPSQGTLSTLIDAADVVVVSGRVELMTAVKKPLVVDLYDPFVLSNLDLFGADFNRSAGRALLALRWLEHHLRNGDFFLCASRAQRSFWLGMLAAAGRINRANYETDPGLDRLLAVVPFGVQDDPPPADGPPVVKGVVPGIDASDRLVLWAGGMWNWVDPLTLIRATAIVRRARPEVKTLLLGSRHPNPEIGEMEIARQARELAAELGLLDTGVFFVDWVPYDERHRWILESEVTVSLHQRGVESEFAFRTRVVDYLWCLRPVVLTEGDELAGMVAERGLGRVVPPDDAEAVAAAIVEVLDDPDAAGRLARLEAARADLAWSRVTRPLLDFCRHPRHARDRSGDAWFAADTTRETAPRKEQALVAEEFVSDARAISPPLGPDYSPAQSFTATYDDLCQIDVLFWIEQPVGSANVVFELTLDGPEPFVVARTTIPASHLPHCDWQRFEFRPLASSRGRDLRFRLTLQGGSEDYHQGRVCVWRCAGPHAERGEGIVFIARYLVGGVLSDVPSLPEDFLFLHNTSLALGERDGEAAVDPEAELDSGPPALDLDSLRVALGRTQARAAEAEARVDRLLAEVERRASHVALEATRAELHQQNTFEALARDTKRAFVRANGRLRRALSLMLIPLLGAACALVSLCLAVAIPLLDFLRRPRKGAREQARDATRRPRPDDPVSIVIPTWNGRGLLEMSLPALFAAVRAHGHPDDEIVVVDNGSDDGSVELLAQMAEEAPWLRVVALATNEGFAGAANRGTAEARNPVLILLNNDMVVEPDFIQPLLDVFGEEPDVFGVSCQIDFIDPEKPRWETGKVHGEFRYGLLRLFHLDRFDQDKLYPIFFAGGGASAYDRERFLALGGFDEAVFSPVYIEDVDLGYRAWKRGWPSLLAPRSLVHHKHRGTTRRLWSEARIHSFFRKNLAALVWKNMDSPQLVRRHLLGLMFLPERVRREQGIRASLATVSGLIRQVPATLRARWRERAIPRVLEDQEILDLSRHRYVHRARFHAPAEMRNGRPQVLIVSPYSPAPAIHGGAVRMLNLIREMRERCDVTLLSFTDTSAETSATSLAALRELCRDVVLLPRDLHGMGGLLAPTGTQGFFSSRMFEMLETWLDRRRFDVVQIEYTHMAQYLPRPCPGMLRVLVEHDVSFVAAARARQGEASAWRRMSLWMDGLRTLRHEVRAVEAADRVLAMSEVDREALARFVDPEPIDVVPNGVSCRDFPFRPDEAEPASILFVGFFRHEPNVEAVLHFAGEIWPLIRREVPDAVFRIVGAYPPDVLVGLAAREEGIELAGRVAETGSYYRRSTVFVAPIRRGSGTRLKILEAMASGCPVVSTSIGAEGLGAASDEIRVADDPAAFAREVVTLIREPATRRALVERSRRFAEANFDWPAIAGRLFAAYGWNGRPETEGSGA